MSTPAEVRHIFHRLWTKAVGTSDYVKAEWKELDWCLEQLLQGRKDVPEATSTPSTAPPRFERKEVV